jgi:hypothetical protein
MARELFSWAFFGEEPSMQISSRTLSWRPKKPGEVFRSLWHALTTQLGRFPNIEELMAGCQHIHPYSREIGLIPPLLEVQSRFSKVTPDVVEMIEYDLLCRLKEQWLHTSPDRTQYLQPLLQLESIFPKEHLKIFSLNYDMVVERACAALGIGCDDGFKDGCLSINAIPVFEDSTDEGYIDPRLAIYMWATPTERSKLRTRVDLYKLHGSASWFRKSPVSPGGEEPRQVYGSMRRLKREGLGGIHDPATPLAKLSEMADQIYWSSEGKWYYSLMIFGVTNKVQPVQPFIHLYEYFYKFLRRGNPCIVIGYSFHDDYVNLMLRDAFNCNAGILGQKRLPLVVVDVDDKTDLLRSLAISEPSLIWQFVGRTGAVLADPKFRALVEDLALRSRTDLPKLIRVSA